MLKLEAGKRYWRRDGGVSGPLVKTEIDHPAFRFSDGLSKWYEDGVFLWGREESEYDLVREYTEPQPLEWKRGIPTEEECRECWIVDGLSGASPCCNSVGNVHYPGATTPSYWWAHEWYIALRIKPVEPPKPKTRTVTQRQYFNAHGSELWTHMEVLETFWTPSTLTRTREVPCE